MKLSKIALGCILSVTSCFAVSASVKDYITHSEILFKAEDFQNSQGVLNPNYWLFGNYGFKTPGCGLTMSLDLSNHPDIQAGNYERAKVRLRMKGYWETFDRTLNEKLFSVRLRTYSNNDSVGKVNYAFKNGLLNNVYAIGAGWYAYESNDWEWIDFAPKKLSRDVNQIAVKICDLEPSQDLNLAGIEVSLYKN